VSLEQSINQLNDNIVKLIVALGANPATAVATGNAPEPTPAKPKAAAPAEKVKAATAKPSAAQNAEAAKAPIAKTVTQQDIQQAGIDLTELAEIDRAAAVGILQEFGVAKMTAAKPEQIPAIHARVKAKLVELKGGAAEEPEGTSLV
jgi:hypothetical protein